MITVIDMISGELIYQSDPPSKAPPADIRPERECPATTPQLQEIPVKKEPPGRGMPVDLSLESESARNG
jgi:hypothetical protein